MSATKDPSGHTIPSRRLEEAVVAMLQHPSTEKAAASIGVTAVTLWRWTKTQAFQEAFRKARRETFAQAIARLQQASSAAVSTLLKVMVDVNSPAASRVRAAGYVLEHALHGMELEEIDVRLSRLEDAQDYKS